MPALLDFRSLLRRHREERSGDVHDLARRLGSGEDVDPEAVIRATTAAGMSDDDFLELVDLVRTRHELKRLAATAPAIDAELAAIRQAIAKHRATLDDAERKYREAVTPLAYQERDAETRAAEANNARGQLTDARNLPRGLVDAIDAARAAVHKAGAAVNAKREELDKQTARSKSAREELDRHYGGADKAIAELDGGAGPRDHNSEWMKLVENAKYGAVRAGTAREELDQLVAIHAGAEKALRHAEQAAREF
jgi:chromosome segregation ATPase